MATPAEIQDRSVILTDAILNNTFAEIRSLVDLSYDTAALFPNVPGVNLALIDTSGGLSSTFSTTSFPNLVSYSSAVVPTVPVLSDVPTPNVPVVPTFDESSPTLNLPTAPISTRPSSPGNAPEFVSPSLPVRPSLSIPDVPSLAAIAIPVVPSIDIPFFDAVLPIDELIEPSTNFDFIEESYSSDLLSVLRAKLSGDLTNGGYGIDPADEIALWERARERELKAADAAIDEAVSQIAARGYILPPGALFAAQQIAEQDVLDKSSTLSREIALKRADLYVQNRQFAITQSSAVESMLIQYAGARAERALNAAKSQIELGISLYNLRVQKFQALLEGYRTQGQIYETKIRANLSTLEAYKAQIEAARTGVETQQLQVTVYRSQIEAANAGIALYRTEMEAAQIQAQIENLKLGAFRTSVESYAAQVGAREAEFKVFEAQIRGEISKIDAFRTSAEAYQARVGAIKIKAEAEEIASRSQIQENQMLLDQYRANIDGYRAQIERVNAENKSILELSGLGFELEKVLDSKEQTRKQTTTQIAIANAGIYAENAKLNIEVTRAQLEAFLKIRSAALGGVAAGVDAQARIASAALQQLSAVVT
jgi:hypothetical protein